MLTVRLSDYQRFGLAQAAINDAAGEDLRYLDRSSPAAALPGYDHWIFDEHTVRVLEFDDRDDLIGAHVIPDWHFVELRTGTQRAAPKARYRYRRAGRGTVHQSCLSCIQ